MTKKQINDLKLEYNNDITITFLDGKTQDGKFRHFGDHVVIVDNKRQGHLYLPERIKDITIIENE